MISGIDLESSHDRDDLFDDGIRKKEKKVKKMFGGKKDTKDSSREKKDKKHKREKSNGTTSLSVPPPQITPVSINSSLERHEINTTDIKELGPFLTDGDNDDLKANRKSGFPLGSPGRATKEKDIKKSSKSKIHSSNTRSKPSDGPPAPNYVPSPPVVDSQPERAGLSAEATIVMSRRKQGANTNPSRVGPSAEAAMVMKERKTKYNTLPSELPSSALSKIGRSDSDEQVEDMNMPGRSETLSELNINSDPQAVHEHSGSVTFREDTLNKSKSDNRKRNTTLLPTGYLQVSLKVEFKGKQLPSLEVGIVSYPKLMSMVAQLIGIDLDFVRSISLVLRLEYKNEGDFVELTEDNMSIIYTANFGYLRVSVVDEE